MSHTDHYEVTVEQILSMLAQQGRNPRRMEIPCSSGHGTWDVLLWDMKEEDNYHEPGGLPLGVELSFHDGFLEVDKGCGDMNCWNGQSVLASLLKRYLSIDCSYSD